MCNCKICDSKDLKEVYDSRQESVYYFCEVCEFIFQDDSQYVSLDKEKEVYDQHDNNFECEGYVQMFKNFINKSVEPFINENTEKILDFGCGPGPVLAELFKRKSYDVYTYDPIYDPNEEYLSNKYDLITSTEVFEHFSDPLSELERLSSLLKPGGILAIMTLLRPDTVDEFKNWWYKRDITHISFYSPKTLFLLGKKYDLKMIYNDNKRLVTFKKI